MRATGYSGLPAHQAAHDELRARFDELAESHRSGTRRVDEDLINFLVAWLDQHIDQEDRRMAGHILGAADRSVEGAGFPGGGPGDAVEPRPGLGWVQFPSR
jgi:hemerythrin